MTELTILGALAKVKEACGVVSELGDELFIHVLKNALRKRPIENIAQLAEHIDAACQRVCQQIVAELSPLQPRPKKQRRKPKRRGSSRKR